MRIAILTVGSRGDVQPYTALAIGLGDAGHDVTLATHEPFRGFVESHGVALAPLPGDPREVLGTPEAHELLASGRSIVRFAGRFLKVLKPWFHDLTRATAPLVAEADFVLYSPLAFTGWHQAKARGIGTAQAVLQPFARTGAFSTVSNGGADHGRIINRASHLVTEQLFWQPLRGEVNRWRTSELGLPAQPISGPFRELRAIAEPQLCGFSPTLVPPPSDWRREVEVTGAWFLDQPAPADPALDAFLADGPPPVYAGFGSMVDSDAGAISDLVVRAARLAGVRLVLGSGWAGLAYEGDDVLVVGDTPHSHLFPRMAAVIHHGGAGTTHTAARAGVPQIVVPFFADQPFWARRVEALGIGPAGIPRKDLTTQLLAEAIRSSSSPGTNDRANQVGAAIAAERGVDAAVAAVARLTAPRIPG
ncbi:MAG: glycosyltransferase [Acidimicrobiia bacterium]